MIKNRLYRVILALAVQLFLLGQLAIEPLEASNYPSEEVFPPVSAKERDRLNLVSFFPVIVEGAVVGGLAAYDDATTQRAADYLELYDNAGNLLAVGWFDGFGIERIAIDLGLLEASEKLQGVFI
ncbi:MAG TPA: hypothetical protein VHP35_08915, partial [Terriglobia bacterium]|nr:hypothetical protein [Terriglobia bacterium]